jgi:hypothetical protein
MWVALGSIGGNDYTVTSFGLGSDLPQVGDFDGDGPAKRL